MLLRQYELVENRKRREITMTKYDILVKELLALTLTGQLPAEVLQTSIDKAEAEGSDRDKSQTEQMIEAFTSDIQQ